MSVESSSVQRNLADDPAAFDVRSLDHAVASGYQPAYLTRGAENIVYEIPEHPAVIVKANGTSIADALDSNLDNGHPPNAFPEEFAATAAARIEKTSVRFHNLRDFFGKDHVPYQRQVFVKVPVTPAILAHAYDGKPRVETTEAWAIITIQKKVPDILKGTHISPFAGSYAQKWFKDLPTLCASDDTLRTAICSFLERAQEYSLKTGELLDVYGADNISFFKEGGDWKYVMVDALYEDKNINLTEGKAVIEKIRSGGTISAKEHDAALYTLRYILNFYLLTQGVGIENKLSLMPGGYSEQLELYNKLSGKK